MTVKFFDFHVEHEWYSGGRCVTLKLKLSSFDVLTRSITPKRLVSSHEDILIVIREVLERELPREIRLLGIRLSNLQFVNERLTDTPISVLDFWKRRQKVEQITTAMSETSSSVSDLPKEVVSNSGELVSCPICNVVLENDDRVVNQHLDECLNNSLLLDSTGVSFESKERLPKKRERMATIENYFTKRKHN